MSINSNTVVKTNVVDKEATRFFELHTLKVAAEKIFTSAGPKGSLTAIVKRLSKTADGANLSIPVTSYTKDGHTILENLTTADNGLLCNSILFTLTDVTRYTKQKVGDGSTSAVCDAAYIFELLTEMEEETNIPPKDLAKKFQAAVDKVSAEIRKHKKDFTYKEAYNIAYISSNGDEEVANNISSLYKELGNELVIEPSISPDEDDHMKIIDGMTIERGYNSPAYKNDLNGGNKCTFKNPRIYYFRGAIDTPDQIELFNSIIYNNVLNYYMSKSNKAPIPTLIFAPRLSRDLSPIITNIIRTLQQYDSPEVIGMKPPICIVSNLAPDSQEQVDDIMRLCGVKPIIVYNSLERKKEDQESGLAPTAENVSENFFGTAELVEVDPVSTKFVNPQYQFCTVGDKRKLECEANGEKFVPQEGDDEIVNSPMYDGLLAGLRDQYQIEKSNGSDIHTLGNLNRRINSLLSKFVYYQVGGITEKDRDKKLGAVKDAVSNCASASKCGVGLACNMEGYFAAKELMARGEGDEFVEIILKAYTKYLVALYEMSFGITEEKATKLLESNTREDGVVDLDQGLVDGTKVAVSTDIQSSIESDPVILNGIAKIVTLLINTVQVAITDPMLNMYSSIKESLDK